MIDYVLACALVLLQVPDIVTTNRILEAGGRELNPFVRWLMRFGRLWWVPKIAVAVGCAAVFVCTREEASRWVMLGLIGVYVFVVGSNLQQIARLKRRGLL